MAAEVQVDRTEAKLAHPDQSEPEVAPGLTFEPSIPNLPQLDQATGQTILLVEDEFRVRNVTRQVLEAGGYNVLVAQNASEAIQISVHQRQRLRVVITDVVLPDKSGCDLASELCAKFPDLKTILISGYPESAVTRDCSRSAGRHYLAKPFSRNSLLKIVQLVLTEP